MYSFRTLLLLCPLAWLLASCEPRLRVRMLGAQSLEEQGYTRFDLTVGQARSYTNLLKLKNGRATEYQALESDGSQWANRFTIQAATNGVPFTSNGTLVPESMRSLFQPGNRYVWDLGLTNAVSVSLD